MTLAYNAAGLAAVPEEARTGLVLEGRYALGVPLGSGGMGTVYSARQLRLDRDVAIKILDPGVAQNVEAAARFLREAKLLSKIRHPNVIQVLDYGESEEGLMYCVMELLVGSDLERLQARIPHGCMPWPGACDLLAQIADGLAAVHALDIVHRDVKPSNCFVSFEGANQPLVKLLDFGVARSLIDDGAPALTHDGLIIGTPSHIAPELLRTQTPASPASDLYSLGVVAYRLLSAKLPFVGDTLFTQMNAACFDEPAPLDDPDLDIPVELQELIVELLAKEPHQRPPSAMQVADRLRLVAGRGSRTTLHDLPLRDALPRASSDSSPSHPLPSRDAPTVTVAVPRHDSESIEEVAPEDVVELAAPWFHDRRLWLLATLILAVIGIAFVVALTDDTPPTTDVTSTPVVETSASRGAPTSRPG